MLRQRVLTRSFPLARVAADALVLIFALVLVWGGAMLVLLAFKASPDTINGLSGYRTAYDYLAGLEPRDVTASTRLIAAIGGLIACLIFGYLAWRAVPRPYLAVPTYAWPATRAAASTSIRTSSNGWRRSRFSTIRSSSRPALATPPTT